MAREIGWYGWFKNKNGERYEAYWDGSAWTERRPQQVMVSEGDETSVSHGPHAVQASEDGPINKQSAVTAVLVSLLLGAVIVPLVAFAGLALMYQAATEDGEGLAGMLFLLLVYGGIVFYCLRGHGVREECGSRKQQRTARRRQSRRGTGTRS